jgi:hypothetical protein
VTKEDALERGKREFSRFQQKLAEVESLTDAEIIKKCGWDARAGLKRMIAEGEEACIKRAMEGVENGSPILELVKEDWPGAADTTLNPAKAQPMGGRFA